MKKTATSLAAFLLIAASAFGQATIGTPGYVASPNYTLREGPPAQTPLNGNDTLNMTYSNTACGLNYSLTSVRLGQRFVPVGLPQPAPMPVTAVPSCGTVLKAYLYTEALGVASSITATLTNPANQTTNVPMTLIGSSVDVCWGMNGTHVWRADVTSLVTGSGTYTISGLPVTPNSSSGVDVEGATLLIIYADPSATYTGSIQIDDGCHTVAGGGLSHTMTGFNACAASTSASAFMLVGDMQMTGYTISMNGNNVPQPQWNWWNEISTVTNVTAGQNSSIYTMGQGGDCFTLAVAGLYFQTACNTCTPTVLSLNLSSSSTPATCANNGSASVTATGGNGNYSYLWFPGGMTTSSVSGLAPGTYTVNVTDGTMCATTTVTIAYAGPVITTSTVAANCQGPGSASAAVSGGTGPYTYLWLPSGGNQPVANNMASGTYTVYATDATGCTISDTVFVPNAANLMATMYTTNDSCPSPTGTAFAYATGGTGPYSFLWSTGDTAAYLTSISAGMYTCTVTDAAGCSVTITDTVGTSPVSYSLMAYGSTIVNCGDSTLLSAYCSDPTSVFSWTPAALCLTPNASSTLAFPTVNTTFYVTASGQCGSGTDTVVVTVSPNNYYNEQICFVTVDTATNHNLVVWERWNSPSSGSYNIYRETSVSGNYALIASQPVSQFSTYLDVTSNPLQMANRYVITTVDPCGTESDTSFHHRSIHLQVSPSAFGGWNLAWTAYEGLPIQTYNIYRGASISTMTLLTQVSGSVFTYTDLTPPPGNIWYMIEAVHPFGGCNPARLAGPGSSVATEYGSILSNLEYTSSVGMEESSNLQSSLLVSPNPGNGVFVLQCNSSTADVTVTITDALGRTVYTSVDNGQSGVFRKEMDLTSLAAGVYNVQVNNGSAQGVTRLVITE